MVVYMHLCMHIYITACLCVLMYDVYMLVDECTHLLVPVTALPHWLLFTFLASYLLYVSDLCASY